MGKNVRQPLRRAVIMDMLMIQPNEASDSPGHPVLHIGVTAATLTGNRGAEAMFRAVEHDLLQRFGDRVRLHLLSYSPCEDRHERGCDEHPSVHDARPLALMTRWLPSMLLPVRQGHHEAVRPDDDRAKNLLHLRLILDLAGVSFIDGREIYLPYNALTLLPFIAHGIPVVKLSQAIGPIRGGWNRFAASRVLPRCQRIFARGSRTLCHLEQAGIAGDQVTRAADLAFLLPPATRSTPSEVESVGIIPSALVARQNPGYAGVLEDFARRMVAEGRTVRVIAHSWKTTTSHPRNNDLPLARRIAAAAGLSPDAVIGPGHDAAALKSAIGGCRWVVCSRFHGMIAALDSAVVPLVVGWSHKYLEVLEDFGLQDLCIDHRSLDADTLHAGAIRLEQNHASLAGQIRSHLPAVRASARSQMDWVAELIHTLADGAAPNRP